MFKFLRQLKKEISSHEPLIKVVVHRLALLDNLNAFRQKYDKLAFAPVLKSNAYGHGILEVAGILDRERLPFFVTDSLFEARMLQNEGIHTPVLVIGYTSVDNISSRHYPNIIFTITSLDHLKLLNSRLKIRTDFHLKIDTGMHRQGIMEDEIEEAMGILKKNSRIRLVGLCTHFADADNPDASFTDKQVEVWNRVAEAFKNAFSSIKHFHCANSAGVYYSKKAFGNVARLGISLYGINVSPFENVGLKPVLEMSSIISAVKNINAGEYVGYNITFKAEKPMKIATVPAGYFEGVDRRLSNVGVFTVGGKECPIVGRVSMNITTIDVSAVPEVKMGDRAVIISADAKAGNSIENISRQIGAIAYENLVHIPAHLKRVVVD